MDTCLNDSYFSAKSLEDVGKGMYVEGTDILGPYTTVYKFVESSEIKYTKQYASPWWFQESTLRKILVDARWSRHAEDESIGRTASKLARGSAGLSGNWRKEGYLMAGSNYLLVGKLLSLTRCWYGGPKAIGSQHAITQADKKLIELGKYQSKKNPITGLDSHMDSVSYLEVIPDPRCTQLYIPGMYEIANRLMAVKPRVNLRNSLDLYSGEIEVFITGLRV